jgi:tetratricopeptide (TPR) repeat protein
LAYNIGVLLQKEGLCEEAAQCYQRAIESSPEFGEALLNLGQALKTIGREDEAKIYWQQALEAKPELAADYFAPAQ